MKKKLAEQALNHIDDAYIQEAAFAKRRIPWVGVAGAVAAVLAFVLLIGIFLQPAAPDITLQDPSAATPTAGITLPHDTLAASPVALKYGIATAKYPVVSSYPKESDSDAYAAWRADLRALHNQPLGYADNLTNYFEKIIPALLADNNGKNAACSPANIYMALAMLAEITSGESRQQILDLMNTDSIGSLRTQAGHVWRAHYNNDGLSTSILGSSLWLEEGYEYNEATARLLAEKYFASVFRGDLGSAEMDEALQSWLNEQTMGLLEQQVQNVCMPPKSLLALATTICYQVQWKNQFHEESNTEAVFHGAAGDTLETFMRQMQLYGVYYWGENFSAVCLPLEDNSRMWLILPDEGTTPESLLKSGEVAAFFAQKPHAANTQWQNKKSMQVGISVPKFDICSDLEISDTLKALGITHVFDAKTADFSPIISNEDGGCVSKITHAARVKIDEDGLTAAAYTLILYAGAAQPPEEKVDFTLDRPFLFYVESNDGLPLFTGIVNEP